MFTSMCLNDAIAALETVTRVELTCLSAIQLATGESLSNASLTSEVQLVTLFRRLNGAVPARR